MFLPDLIARFGLVSVVAAAAVLALGCAAFLALPLRGLYAFFTAPGPTDPWDPPLPDPPRLSLEKKPIETATPGGTGKEPH